MRNANIQLITFLPSFSCFAANAAFLASRFACLNLLIFFIIYYLYFVLRSVGAQASGARSPLSLCTLYLVTLSCYPLLWIELGALFTQLELQDVVTSYGA